MCVYEPVRHNITGRLLFDAFSLSILCSFEYRGSAIHTHRSHGNNILPTAGPNNILIRYDITATVRAFLDEAPEGGQQPGPIPWK